MYPNNSQYTNPADYLNQISTHIPQKKNILSGKPPLLIAGVGAVILLILIMTISSLFTGGVKPTEQLAARLVSTSSTAESATANLKSSQLRALNSNLKLYLTNTIRDITPILAANSVKISSLNKKAVAAESNVDLLSTLEDARLNAVYDRTYAREMSYQLDTILTLMLKINNSTTSKSLKTFLADARTNLVEIQKQFSAFNLTTG